MDTFTLAAETGREPGTRPSRRLRREGKVPGVLYGHGAEPTSVAVDRRAFRRVISEAGANAVVNLELDGKVQLTIVKDLQRDPVANRIIHIDFQAIDASERMTVEVPIVLEGEAAEVGREGGVVQQQLMALTVTAPALSIPQSLPLDISEMALNDQLQVSDLVLPRDVTTEVDPETVVVIAQISRAALALEEEEAAAAAEAEAEAEGEPGEAPAEAAAEDASADEGAGGDGDD
jgi:large subunit ribosomal protein L25